MFANSSLLSASLTGDVSDTMTAILSSAWSGSGKTTHSKGRLSKKKRTRGHPLKAIKTIVRLKSKTLVGPWQRCRRQSCIQPSRPVVESDETPRQGSTSVRQGMVLGERRTHSVQRQKVAISRG